MNRPVKLLIFTVFFGLTAIAQAADKKAPAAEKKAAPAALKALELTSGKVEFSVETNIRAFRFKGDATELAGKASLDGLNVASAEITIPVKSISTHMDLRDKHMRERIFNKADGSSPDVTFKADKSACEKKDASLVCTLKGTLSVRGEARPKEVVVTATPADQPANAKGSFKIILSEHGIPAPENLGVKVKDEVPVDFEVSLK